MDSGNWKETFKFKAKQKNLAAILNIIEGMSSTNVDDAVIYSFLNYQGILIEKNEEKAKHILENKLVS